MTNQTKKAIAMAIASKINIPSVARKAWVDPAQLEKVLVPVPTFEKNGLEVYAYQWGDVTFIAKRIYTGEIDVKEVAW